MTIVMSHWRAAQYPINKEYLLRSESLARSTIDTMTGFGQNKVTDLFRRACQQRPNLAVTSQEIKHTRQWIFAVLTQISRCNGDIDY